jgi:hypothetical protein
MTRDEAVARIRTATKRVEALTRALTEGDWEEELAPRGPPEPDQEERQAESWPQTRHRWWEAEMRLNWPDGVPRRRRWRFNR